MRNAYVVSGPQSSGNRLLISALVRAGCHGGGTKEQLPDKELLDGRSPSVLICHPFIEQERQRLRRIVFDARERDYAVRFLLTVRDHYAVARSDVEKWKRAPGAVASIHNQQEAVRGTVLVATQAQVPFLVVPYESLVLHGNRALKPVLEWCGLRTDNLGDPMVWEGKQTDGWKDGNAKWYEEASDGGA